jgi:hypothetical protein
MLMGRLTVNLDLNHVFSLNPVGDKFKDAELLQFGNLHELKIFLDQAGKMTKDVYTDMVSNQRGLAGQILQEVDYGRMNMFFDNIRGGVA